MTKYDSLKYLKPTKARKTHICSLCGREIPPAEQYLRETIDWVSKPNVELRAFCMGCYAKYGDRLLKAPTRKLRASLGQTTLDTQMGCPPDDCSR